MTAKAARGVGRWLRGRPAQPSEPDHVTSSRRVAPQPPSSHHDRRPRSRLRSGDRVLGGSNRTLAEPSCRGRLAVSQPAPLRGGHQDHAPADRRVGEVPSRHRDRRRRGRSATTPGRRRCRRRQSRRLGGAPRPGGVAPLCHSSRQHRLRRPRHRMGLAERCGNFLGSADDIRVAIALQDAVTSSCLSVARECQRSASRRS